jgi:hypothetical protein
MNPTVGLLIGASSIDEQKAIVIIKAAEMKYLRI